MIERLRGLPRRPGALVRPGRRQYFSRSADAAFGAVSGLDAGDDGGRCSPSAAATRAGRARRTRSTRWSGWPRGPASPPGRPGSAGAAGLARGVRGDRHRVSGRRVRRPGGRHRPDLPAPRDERFARPGGALWRPRAPVFARHYAHAGMVRLDGEKMSKSLGNLVFVSRLLAGRHRPDGDPAGDPRAPLPAATGTGPTPGLRRRRRGSTAGGPRSRRPPPCRAPRPRAAASGRGEGARRGA